MYLSRLFFRQQNETTLNNMSQGIRGCERQQHHPVGNKSNSITDMQESKRNIKQHKQVKTDVDKAEAIITTGQFLVAAMGISDRRQGVYRHEF